MRLSKPWSLRSGFTCTAMRSNTIFRDYGVPARVRQAELKRRLFRVLYPRADKRQQGPRSREAAMWLHEPKRG